MTYTLAIFDFDGTLADSGAWMFQALNGVADRYGCQKVDLADVHALRGCDSREIMRRLGVPAWKLPRIAQHVRERMALEADTIPLFEGTPRLLRTLADQGVALAIVSSNSDGNVRRILGPDCAALIGCYECGASVFGKARKFGRVLQRLGHPGSGAICIGDEARDIDAATKAGLASGAVTWGYATSELLQQHQPTLLFRSMEEVAARLAGRASDDLDGVAVSPERRLRID